jgi:hypothetical protein
MKPFMVFGCLCALLCLLMSLQATQRVVLIEGGTRTT